MSRGINFKIRDWSNQSRRSILGEFAARDSAGCFFASSRRECQLAVAPSKILLCSLRASVNEIISRISTLRTNNPLRRRRFASALMDFLRVTSHCYSLRSLEFNRLTFDRVVSLQGCFKVRSLCRLE